MNSLQLLSTPKSIYLKAPKSSLGGCAIWDLAAVSLILEECQAQAHFYDGRALHLNRSSIFFNDVGLAFCSADLDYQSVRQRLEQIENGL